MLSFVGDLFAQLTKTTIDTTIYEVEYRCNIMFDSITKTKHYICYDIFDTLNYMSFTTINNKLFGNKLFYSNNTFSVLQTFINDRLIYEEEYYSTIIMKGWYNPDSYNKEILYNDSVSVEQNDGIYNEYFWTAFYAKEGKWEYYYDSGEKHSEGYYKNNKRVGLWLYYFPFNSNPNREKVVEKYYE